MSKVTSLDLILINILMILVRNNVLRNNQVAGKKDNYSLMMGIIVRVESLTDRYTALNEIK